MSEHVLTALAAGGLFVMVLAFTMVWSARYVKVGPNEALIVSGRAHRLRDGRVVGVRIVKGGATFIMPVLEKAEVLSLGLMTIEIQMPETPAANGLSVTISGTAQVKIGGDEVSIANAAERFLKSTPKEIAFQATQLVEGAARDVVSKLTIEEAVGQREAFADRVMQAAGERLAPMGLRIESFVVREIADPQGCLQAAASARVAEVKRDAAIAQAQAEREMAVVAADHRTQAERARAEAERAVMEAQAHLAPRCGRAACGAANLPGSRFCRMCGEPLGLQA